MQIGKLEKVPIRDIWKNEAKDFSQWLEQNIDILGESLDLSLSVVDREHKAGIFSVDLLAEDGAANRVIIENQLEKTDHDHLGKVITYLTSLEAKTAIWICSSPRQEHIKAIEWLNEFTPADVSFYIVQIEGVRIGNSDPAPLFSVICAPSEEGKELGSTKKEMAERDKKRFDFWKLLLEKANQRTYLHAGRNPRATNWISAGAGKTGLSYDYGVTNNSCSVVLYIDRGKDEKETNRKIFHSLLSKRDIIEKDFGGDLTWKCEDERRSCTIWWTSKTGGLKDEKKWGKIQDEMIDAMIRFERALRDHINRLKI